MFSYCPACASKRIAFIGGKKFHCPDCGFVYYHNICAATGLVISSGGKLLLLVRGKEPSRGKLDLPGGFVDLNEGIVDGLRRECREEIGWDPGPAVQLYASFPNVYHYKNIDYNTCDCFFRIEADGLSEKDFTLQQSEIAGIRFLVPAEITGDDMAFPSTWRAIRAYRDNLRRPVSYV
jgi:ADP-ribose pyrophosphatase YjhB (NUDIX family)